MAAVQDRPNRPGTFRLPKHAALFDAGKVLDDNPDPPDDDSVDVGPDSGGTVVATEVHPRGPTEEVEVDSLSNGSKVVKPKRKRQRKSAASSKVSEVRQRSVDRDAVDEQGSLVNGLYGSLFTQRGERG